MTQPQLKLEYANKTEIKPTLTPRLGPEEISRMYKENPAVNRVAQHLGWNTRKEDIDWDYTDEMRSLKENFNKSDEEIKIWRQLWEFVYAAKKVGLSYDLKRKITLKTADGKIEDYMGQDTPGTLCIDGKERSEINVEWLDRKRWQENFTLFLIKFKDVLEYVDKELKKNGEEPLILDGQGSPALDDQRLALDS